MATIRVGAPDDRERLHVMRVQAFNVNPAAPPAGIAPMEEYRVVEDDGVVVGAMRRTPERQYFGGNAVPTTAIGSVMIDAEARGKGIARDLFGSALNEMHDDGIALSTLYPSTMPVYRKLGYEVAGSRAMHAVTVRLLPRSKGHTVESWDDAALADVQECYRRFASAHDGSLERSEDWWRERIVVAGGKPVYKYLVRDDSGVCGYIIYTQDKINEGHGYNHLVACRDLIWTNDTGARALLNFIADDRALATDLYWPGPHNEPLATYFDEQDIRTEWSFDWMLRLVRVDDALTSRGYAADIDETFELTVEDEVIPANAGAIRVTIRGGSATVERIDVADGQVDVGMFAAIYSGWLRPSDAARVGRIVGASEQTIAAMDRVFAGPSPWMVDMF